MNQTQLNSPVIKVENLSKRFGAFTAVDGVSFHVRPGECFGILGPNGAGKTSTIKMIYGFSPITEGGLQVFGMDIRRKWRSIRARIGVCHQENSLDPELSVLENLIVYARFFDMDRAVARSRALELLELIALDQRRDSPVSELSGGMMRRLVLARALINRPDILILDEPTTGLDYRECMEIMGRIVARNRAGATVMMVCHDMEVVQDFARRVLVVAGGALIGDGPTGEIMTDASLLARASVAPAQIPQLALRFGNQFSGVYTIEQMADAIEGRMR